MGRSLPSAVADLKAFSSVPSFASAMKGYLALSRVESANGLLISLPFSPQLFCQGPQPFPTLLLETMRQGSSDTEVLEKCTEVGQLEQNSSS